MVNDQKGIDADLVGPLPKLRAITTKRLILRKVIRRHVLWVGNIGAFNKAAIMRGNTKAVTIKDINSVGAGANENHLAVITAGNGIINAGEADMAGSADLSCGKIQRFGTEISHKALKSRFNCE